MFPRRSPAHARVPLLFAGALILVAAPIAAPSAAPNAPAPKAPNAVAPAANLPAGLVTAKDGAFRGLMIKTRRPGHYLPAPLLATEVEIDVTGAVARTRVRQHYLNPSKAWIEGVYVFPLADKSAIDVLRMRIGDRVIEGEIKERGQAKKIYEAAKAQGRKASLLESHRPNIFMSSVANIGPGENITIEIAYQKTVAVRDGEYRLRFPMVVGPRYFPKGQAGLLLTRGGTAQDGATPRPDVPDAAARHRPPDDSKVISSPVLHPDDGKINPLTLQVRFAGGSDLAALKSHHHPVTVTEAEDGSRLVKLAKQAVPADRDFELTWQVGGEDPTALLFTEHWQGKHYGLVMIAPPKDATSGIIRRGREVVFVIDTSGSMAGRSIRQAKASLNYALGRLTANDRFNLIQFNSSTDALFDRAVPATRRNTLMARAYVSALKANGGTEMRGALFAALDRRVDASRLRQVVFMTDGAVGNESQLFHTITRRLGDSRLFTVGIGSAPNRFFMRGAARQGRGTFTFIGRPGQVEARMKALWRKLSQPVVTHVSVAAAGETAVEMWPDPVPDLFAGEPVFFAVRFDGRPGDLIVKGQGKDGVWQQRLSFASAPSGPGIAKLWAREKIAGLNMLKYRGVPAEEIRTQVLKTALRHKLVTRHTSLVAVDKPVVHDGETPLHTKKLPHNLPHGWQYDKVFGKRPMIAPAGPQKAMIDRARMRFKQAELLRRAPKASPAPKPGKPSATAQTLHLPQTATPQTVFLAVGLFSLLAALLLMLMGRLRQTLA